MGLHLLFTQRWWRPDTFLTCCFSWTPFQWCLSSSVLLTSRASLWTGPAQTAITPLLSCLRSSNCKPYRLALTHVCFSISLPSALSRFSSPTESSFLPTHLTSPLLFSREVIHLLQIHSQISTLACSSAMSPPSYSVPRTLGGAR